ncbi:MAG: aminoglycoside phosphotransferase family protein [Cytophagales bacterium]|nr:MAG: aminoglycoside phosphotransferase family protein [Cytophagales bacterium]
MHYLTPPFIEKIMQQHAPDSNIRVASCEPLPVDNSASILVVLTAGQSDNPIGHYGLLVEYEQDRKPHTRRMVLKVKPHGREIVAMLTMLAGACGGKLAEVFPAFAHLTGFAHTHERELDVYANLPSPLQPDVFGTYADEERGLYLILMEYLEDVTLLNSVMTPNAWTDEHIRQTLRQLARWHADHLDQPLPLNPAYWTDDMPSRAHMPHLTPLWHALLDNAATHFPDLYTPARADQLRAVITAIPTYWQELEVMPKTLIHNDLNPRNTCFREGPYSYELCVYDWELATYHVPQYDVVEFLCFLLGPDRYHLRLEYLEFYRQRLHALTGRFGDALAFRRGFQLAAYDFGLHRLGMYMMAHTVSPYPFLPRVVESYFDTITFSNNP